MSACITLGGSTSASLGLGLGDDGPRLTISIGVADARDADGVGALMEEADARLYRAKRGGRNRIVSEGSAAE